jgi:hypothetical protein
MISKYRDAKHANPRLVAKYYEHYKENRYAIDQIRRRRNEHADQIKNVRVIADDQKREKEMQRHK